MNDLQRLLAQCTPDETGPALEIEESVNWTCIGRCPTSDRGYEDIIVRNGWVYAENRMSRPVQPIRLDEERMVDWVGDNRLCLTVVRNENEEVWGTLVFPTPLAAVQAFAAGVTPPDVVSA